MTRSRTDEEAAMNRQLDVEQRSRRLDTDTELDRQEIERLLAYSSSRQAMTSIS